MINFSPTKVEVGEYYYSLFLRMGHLLQPSVSYHLKHNNLGSVL